MKNENTADHPIKRKSMHLPKEGFVRRKDRVHKRDTVTPVQLHCGFDFHFSCDFLRIYLSYLFILPVLGLCCFVQAFSSCGEQELLFVVVWRLLFAVASLVAKYRIWAHGLQ